MQCNVDWIGLCQLGCGCNVAWVGLSFLVSSVSLFPIGFLGQIWYLIVSIPDLCTLTYLVLADWVRLGCVGWDVQSNVNGIGLCQLVCAM